MSNAGFLGLHNWYGVLLIAFSAFLLTVITIVGSLFFRAKVAAEKEDRAEMRRRIESGKS